MTINAYEIQSIVEKYLIEYPDEYDRIARLCEALGDGSALTSPTEFRGHLTVSVVLVDPAWRVLHMYDPVIRRWTLPGGHLEPTDDSLPGAALRQVYERTGLEPDLLIPLSGFESTPIDIDVRRSPAGTDPDDFDHWHFDIRHAFQISGAPTIRLGNDRLTGPDWLIMDSVPGFALRLKLRALATYLVAA
jgi:8-oxo-dGTP pyrophosphatase MutT (NUDIX family)